MLNKEVLTQNIEINEYKKFVSDFKMQLSKFDVKYKYTEIIFLCVGTNKIIGDSIGPIVGEKLTKIIKYNTNNKIKILGNMNNTLNFKNVEKNLNQINEKYENPFFITIDAALGNSNMINKVYTSSGKIRVGNSLGRSIEINSHINIKGIVGEYSNDYTTNINTLKRADINSIIKLSNVIAYGINEVIKL